MSYYFGKDATFTPDFFYEPKGERYRCARCENGSPIVFVHNAPCSEIGAVPEGQNPCEESKEIKVDTQFETIERMAMACVNGRCTMVDKTSVTPEQIGLCRGKPGGSQCGKEIPECTVNSDCPTGYECVSGKCTPFTEPKKPYIMCVNNVCQERMLTDREAEQLKELIQRCSGKGVGKDCGAVRPDCVSNADCPVGYKCVNGTCIGETTKTLACVGGICKMVDASTPELIAACSGKAVGDECGEKVECTSDADCPTNYHCVDGKCNPFVPVVEGCTDPTAINYNPKATADDGSCQYEDGNGGDGRDGGCEGGYENPSGNPCGYGLESRGIGGVQWCCPVEKAEPLGEYKLPGNMQELLDALIAKGKELLGKEVGFSEAQKTQMLDALPAEGIESLAARRRELLAMRPGYEPEIEAALSSLAASLTKRREMIAGIEPGYTPGTIAEMIGALPKELHGKLMGRGEELLEMPLGFTPESIARMFGLDFERIREREAGGRESLLGTLGAQGKLGTGVVPERMGKLAWGTEQNISTLMRELYIQNELQKREDLSRYTGLAGGIFGQGMDYADLVGRTYGGIEEKEKRDVLDYTAAMLGIAPMEMAALTAPSERRKADVLDYTQAAAQIVPQEMAYARQLQDLLTSFKGMEKADILDFTGMAQGIFGVGAGSEQLVEMINAARRGEGSQALSQLLALLGLLKY